VRDSTVMKINEITNQEYEQNIVNTSVLSA
jgi:hypothetical protein